jgi:hypothetical protein
MMKRAKRMRVRRVMLGVLISAFLVIAAGCVTGGGKGGGGTGSAPGADEARSGRKRARGDRPKAHSHRARYWYVIDNLGEKVGENGGEKVDEKEGKGFVVRLWAALPIDRPGQEVDVREIVPEPAEIIKDPVGGNRVVYWKVTERPEDGRLVFSYDVTVKNRAIVKDLDPSVARRPDPSSMEAKHYTGSEPWLEITPEIRRKAAEIVGDEKNPISQARKVFDWIVEEMTYDYPHVKERGVKRAFSRLKGDCGEFSHVFIAMMRSLGVPARLVTAMWYGNGGHAWAEMFVPPYGWVPVDTSVAQLVKNGLKGQLTDETVAKFIKSRGIPKRDAGWLFGNLYPNRMEVFVGENVEVAAKSDGTTRTFKFMQPGGTGAWPVAIEIEGAKKPVHAGFFRFGKDAGSRKIALEKAKQVLAPAYLKAGLLEKAEKGLEKTVERHPKAAQPWFQLAQVYFGQRRYSKAREAFRKSIAGKGGSTKRTTDTWSHIFIGMSYDAEGKREPAVKAYRAAIEAGADFGGSLATAKKLLKEPYRPEGSGGGKKSDGKKSKKRKRKR